MKRIGLYAATVATVAALLAAPSFGAADEAAGGSGSGASASAAGEVIDLSGRLGCVAFAGTSRIDPSYLGGLGGVDIPPCGISVNEFKVQPDPQKAITAATFRLSWSTVNPSASTLQLIFTEGNNVDHVCTNGVYHSMAQRVEGASPLEVTLVGAPGQPIWETPVVAQYLRVEPDTDAYTLSDVPPHAGLIVDQEFDLHTVWYSGGNPTNC